MKKFLSILLVVMLVLSMIPATVSAATETVATFELGANGSASHADGTSKTSYSETVNGYKLNLTNVSNFYTGARDAKGNGCIKLGASSKAGSFSITEVPENVTSVVIFVAAYKAKTATVTVNGTKYPLTNKSDNGKYDEITVDTSITKTVSLTVSSGYRAMVNTIVFCAEKAEDTCEHPQEKLTLKTAQQDATCTEVGYKAVYTCSCGAEVGGDEIPAINHAAKELRAEAEDGNCKTVGKTATYYCPDCDTTFGGDPTELGGHDYVDGTCSVCGEEEPKITSATYVIGNYPAGTQYAKNEEHILDDYVTMYTTDAHFTTELRLYSSSTNNGYAIIESKLPITSIALNAGNKVDTLVIYGSEDGETWTELERISVTATTYKNYESSEFSKAYKWLKLDVAGTQQVRVKSFTLNFMQESGDPEEPACDHAENKLTVTTPENPATCTEPGKKAIFTCECGETFGGEPIPAINHANKTPKADAVSGTCKTEGTAATFDCPDCNQIIGGESTGYGPHNYVDGVCDVCGEEEPNEVIFQLGKDGGEEHVDGTEPEDGYTETVSGYKLKITDNSKMYSGAKDLKGNGCIKLGTSKATGGFSFTVPEDIGSVVIYIGKYKENNSKVTINGTEYTLTKSSDNGEYDEIIVDTNTNKQITLSTVSGACRAMVNAIKFCVGVDVSMPVVGPGEQEGYETLKIALAGSHTKVKAADGRPLPLDVTIEGTRYIALKADNDGFYTYYKLQMGLSNISLRSSEAGIYYSAKVIAPKLLEALAEEENVSYGVMLSVNGKPADLEAGKHTSISGVPACDTAFHSGSVFGIFKDGADNQKRAGMEIYARAYIKVGERLILSNKDVSWSFVEVLQEVDKLIPTLQGNNEKTKLNELATFYDKWSKAGAIGTDWGLENMKALQVPVA